MRRAALALVAVALVVAACGDDDDGSADETSAGSPAATTTETGGAVVAMNDQLTFEPREITISVGEKVTWENVGNVAHTVTADKSKAADPSHVSIPAGADKWDSGFVGDGESFSRSFEEPGTYRYFCIPHEGAEMVGTVVVEG